MSDSANPWTTAHQDSLFFTVSWSLLKFMSIESMMPSNHLILLLFPFLSCLQSFPALGSFPTSRLFTSGGQSFGAWATATVLPVNIQGWFPLGLTGLIFFQSKGLWRVFSSTTIWKHPFFDTQLYGPTLKSVHNCWGKPQLWLSRHLSAERYLCFLIDI